MLKRFIVTLLLSLIVLPAISSPNPRALVFISGDKHVTTLYASLATTPDARAQGLMFKKSLPKNHGMLFVFQESRVLTFWMKNTLIPLDIIFADNTDQHLRVTNFLSMTPCKSSSHCPLYSSQTPATVALETHLGFAKIHHIHITDKLTWQPITPKLNTTLTRIKQFYPSLKHPTIDVVTFVKNLKIAIKHDHTSHLMRMIALPLRVNGKLTIKTKHQLRAQLNTLFNATVKRVIAEQTLDQLFINDQGIMMGNGQIWFNATWHKGHFQRPFKIIAMNTGAV
jgi:uncharacterized protein